MNAEAIIYLSGETNSGAGLLAGVWTWWQQEGFPLEMAHMNARDKGDQIDWLEAMADASRTNDLPALMDHLSEFLDETTILRLKTGFIQVLKTGKTYEKIVQDKRANGRAYDAAMKRAIAILRTAKPLLNQNAN